MNRENKKKILIISLILIFVSSLPYLYGWLTKPAGTIFLGNGFFNPHDNHVYYAYIKQVINGRYLLEDVFTSERQQPFLNIFWLMVGLLAKFLNLGPIAAFHLARILLIPVFVLAAYNFIAAFFKNEKNGDKKTKLSSILFFFTLGAGGWLILIGTKIWQPWEIWWPEAYAFSSIYSSPHFIASWILIILSFHYFLLGVKNNNYKQLALGGFMGFVLTQFHTFYLALLFPFSLIFALTAAKQNRMKIIKQTALYNLFLAPNVIYYFLIIKDDLVMRQRLLESKMYTPDSPLIIIFVFGLMLPLAIPAVIRHFKKREEDPFWRLAAIWLISAPLLLYSSLPFERRLIEGWQLAVIILATETIYDAWEKIKDKINPKFSINFKNVFFVFIFYPVLIIFLAQIAIYRDTEGRQFYLPQNLNNALILLSQNKPDPDPWVGVSGRVFYQKCRLRRLIKQYYPLTLRQAGGYSRASNKNYDAVILAAPLTGIAATFTADKKIYLGHKFETINIDDKLKKFFWFIKTNEQDEEKKLFLQQNGVKYLIWGPYEKKLNPIFQPEEKKYLNKIYADEGVEIYETLL